MDATKGCKRFAMNELLRSFWALGGRMIPCHPSPWVGRWDAEVIPPFWSQGTLPVPGSAKGQEDERGISLGGTVSLQGALLIFGVKVTILIHYRDFSLRLTYTNSKHIQKNKLMLVTQRVGFKWTTEAIMLTFLTV